MERLAAPLLGIKLPNRYKVAVMVRPSDGHGNAVPLQQQSVAEAQGFAGLRGGDAGVG